MTSLLPGIHVPQVCMHVTLSILCIWTWSHSQTLVQEPGNGTNRDCVYTFALIQLLPCGSEHTLSLSMDLASYLSKLPARVCVCVCVRMHVHVHACAHVCVCDLAIFFTQLHMGAWFYLKTQLTK